MAKGDNFLFNKDSGINHRFEYLLKKYNINYEKEYKFEAKKVKEILRENTQFSELFKSYNRFIDFYLPEYNLFIEINPLFTHCLEKQWDAQRLKRELIKKIKSNVLFIWDYGYHGQILHDDEIILNNQYKEPEFWDKLELLIKNKFSSNIINNIQDIKFVSKEKLESLQQEHIELYKSRKTPIEEAKEKWPEWYQRRIIEKQPRKYITFNKDLYNWWLRIISDPNNIKVGHRYFCAMTLVSYATKCNVSKEEVSKDLYSLLPKFDKKTISSDNHFKKEDIEDALLIYNTKEGHQLTRHSISKLTGIEIKPKKRNGRTKEEHIRHLHALNKARGELYGYPKHKRHETEQYKTLLEYLRNNPLAYSPKKIAKETGLNLKTVERTYKQIIKKIREESPKDGTEQLKPAERSLYYLIKENPDISKKELAETLGVSLSTIYNKYNKLYNLYIENEEKQKSGEEE